MSLLNTYTDYEKIELRKHGLTNNRPSQLSDSFVLGMRNAESATKEHLRLKELECEELEKDKKELVEAIESSMRIKELWLPMHIVANEHEPEAAPLHKMHDSFKQLLERLG